MGHGAIIEGVPVSPAMVMIKELPEDVVRMEEVRILRANKPNTRGYAGADAGEVKC